MPTNQNVPAPETKPPCGYLESSKQTVNIPPTDPQEFDLLSTEREAMVAAGIPLAMLPPLPTVTPEEGHRNAGGFGA